ncbi:MAG: phosphoribosylglycinamide formyltransferase [Candidatus Omnitrophota bacterium]|nr:phosphoribosylglycinamide formyltransferase [Candidatus Omnitrophota bacterium]
MNIAVFASGRGTNLQAIIDVAKADEIKADLSLVISDRKDSGALEKARSAGIEAVYINPQDFSSREDFDKETITYLEKYKIELVVLAGFMRIVSPYFIGKYRNRIMNVHPALLPSFIGTRGIKDAWDYGVKVTGPTVHFVTEDLDSGPIILQKPVIIEDEDTIKTLEEKIHKAEHEIYPRAVKLFIENRLKVEGRRVKINTQRPQN